MKKKCYTILLVTILYVLHTSCTKENEPTAKNSLKASFYGDYYLGDSYNYINGSLQIDVDKKVSIHSLTGSMFGSSEETIEGIHINIEEGSGIFSTIKNLDGIYSTQEQKLNFSGKDSISNVVSFELNIMTVAEMDKNWRDSHQMTGVYFTHYENCNAYVTIEGLTLGPITKHYAEHGFCNPMYYNNGLFYPMQYNYDDNESMLYTVHVALPDWQGNISEWDESPMALFVLPKNTPINYLATWDNGYSEEGTFTTPDGAETIPICIKKQGDDCIVTNPENRILQNTLAIDWTNSLTGFNEDFNFDPEYLSLRISKEIWIGSQNYASTSFIRIYDPAGLKIKTYNLDTENEIEFGVVLSGDRNFEFTNDFNISQTIHNATTKGSVTISKLDTDSEELNIIFNQVIVQHSFPPNSGQPNQHFRFSGTIQGNFYNHTGN